MKPESSYFKEGDLAVEVGFDAATKPDDMKWSYVFMRLVLISFVTETGAVITSSGNRFHVDEDGKWVDDDPSVCRSGMINGRFLVPFNEEWKDRLMQLGPVRYEHYVNVRKEREISAMKKRHPRYYANLERESDQQQEELRDFLKAHTLYGIHSFNREALSNIDELKSKAGAAWTDRDFGVRTLKHSVDTPLPVGFGSWAIDLIVPYGMSIPENEKRSHNKLHYMTMPSTAASVGEDSYDESENSWGIPIIFFFLPIAVLVLLLCVAAMHGSQ